MKLRIIGALLLALVLVGSTIAWFATMPPPAAVMSPASPLPQPTSAAPAPAALLAQSWASYRSSFIQGDGRTIDPMREQATTSEGQSYSLLRAVWMNDQPTFDRVLRWTNDNLRVRGDQLFGFLWGRHANGSWAILDPNVATDADQDIALALIFAERRWNEPAYGSQARAILADLWAKTVVRVNNKPYITAGDWAAVQERPTLNPSYLAPYAYRIFATADPARPWEALIDTSYEVLTACSNQPLDRASSVGLPPNWCALDKAGGVTAPDPNQKLDTNYGYDAFRTYWRIALDAKWFGERRAYDYLRTSNYLRNAWASRGAHAAVYRHDGAIERSEEDATVYGGLIANLAITDPTGARELYEQKLAPRFITSNGQAFWDNGQNYYAQNWIWFGVGLYADALPNLST
ncbi:MAG: glycosyl hydrolase [Chloroflexales bacterium]|nr:glycosyl hydrolase [Chloroflexales bacterium]